MLEAWTRPVLLALPKLKSDTKTKLTMYVPARAVGAQGAPTAAPIRLTGLPPPEKKQRIAHQTLAVDIWIPDKNSKKLSSKKLDEWTPAWIDTSYGTL
jgi:hypothetical protein